MTSQSARPRCRPNVSQDERVEAVEFAAALRKSSQLDAAFRLAELHERIFSARQQSREAEARIIFQHAAEVFEFPPPRVFEDQHIVAIIDGLHVDRISLIDRRVTRRRMAALGRPFHQLKAISLQPHFFRPMRDHHELILPGHQSGQFAPLNFLAVLFHNEREPILHLMRTNCRLKRRLRTDEHALRRLHQHDLRRSARRLIG